MNSPAGARALRVLVIGCGRMAGGFDAEREPAAPPLTHAGAFRAHGGFTLAACVEPDATRRAAFAARWEVPRHAGDLEKLAAAPGDFDVISICSDTAVHAAHLEAALRLRPRLVFCEKPVTASLAETERQVAAYARAGVLLAVNHTRRWAPDVASLAAELRAGAWGSLRSVSGQYNKGALNNGTHLVDLVQLLCGPVTLLAAGRAVVDHLPQDPSVPALLETADGVPVQLQVGDARDYALFELQLVTSRAVLAMRDGGMGWSTREAVDSPWFAGYKALSEPATRRGRYDEAMLAAASNIHDALRQGAALASTGATALAAQRICEEIRTRAMGARA